MKATPSQLKALHILKEHGPIRPREFARLMWPDSEGWRRSTKCGPNGSTRGGGMCLAGGGYLGKLYHKGWSKEVYSQYDPTRSLGYSLTEEGWQALEEDEP